MQTCLLWMSLKGDLLGDIANWDKLLKDDFLILQHGLPGTIKVDDIWYKYA